MSNDRTHILHFVLVIKYLWGGVSLDVLWSNNQRRAHNPTNALSGGYFGKLLVLKIWSINFKLKHISGISAEPSLISSNIQKMVKAQ